jgi:hypothetical protein
MNRVSVRWQAIEANGIKLKADRLYKRFGDGGLILGCVIGCI